MPKISVVIPVYNTGKYLSECLDSVLGQTFTDIEIICINDGSTDNSLNILQKYKKKDSRIKVINQKNSGVIVARNIGIQKASADLIYPLDGDDMIATNTLHELYKAFTKHRGDVITSRVVKFGNESGEMSLPNPTKLNFCRQNCAVNAALFRKSDFIAAGGYDSAYAVALEDYDLWLNFVYRQNLKFYRVPKKLFFYRIKPKSESRNEQHADQRKDIVKTFYTKYPKMRYWLIVSNYLKKLKKIFRFFFRIQDHTVKIFKIPVYKTRKYDTVVSVGAACFVPQVLTSLKLRDFSGPFDWMFGSHIITRLNFIKTGFKNYFNFDDFEYIGENPDNGKNIYKNIQSGIVYNHDFPHGEFKDIFGPVADKYKRRTDRFIEHLYSDKKVLLVFFELNDTGDKQQIIKMMDDINKKYPAHIDLLYVNHNANIKLGKNTRIKRISKYVLYAEYHYKKFPDELLQARKICKKLLKKVAK